MMTRNVKIEVSLLEIILAMKQRWKMILLVTLMCTVLSLVVGLIQTSGNNDNPGNQGIENTAQENEAYEIRKKQYEESLVSREDAKENMQTDWLRLVKIQNTHPLMKVDPYNCEYISIAIRFEPQSDNHYGIVKNWIDSADATKLFGADSDKLGKYKTSLILINDRMCETTLCLIGITGFDIKAAANYLKNYLKDQANVSNIIIDGITVAEGTGYIKEINEFQNLTQQRINTVQTAIKGMSDLKGVFPAPEMPGSVTTENNTKKLMKYILAGVFFGLIAGILVVVMLMFFSRNLVSRRQMENAFNLECLSDCSKEQSASLAVLNANLDIMTDDHNKIMLLCPNIENNLSEMLKNWNENSEREFIEGRDLVNDSSAVDALKETDGIILGVRPGKSNLDDIQHNILRANKLGIEIYGFVML